MGKKAEEKMKNKKHFDGALCNCEQFCYFKTHERKVNLYVDFLRPAVQRHLPAHEGKCGAPEYRMALPFRHQFARIAKIIKNINTISILSVRGLAVAPQLGAI